VAIEDIRKGENGAGRVSYKDQKCSEGHAEAALPSCLHCTCSSGTALSIYSHVHGPYGLYTYSLNLL